jgi:O-antigen/teichoic acid export membrane protein
MSSVSSRSLSRGLVGNSIALLATSQIGAVLGYLFWIACARGFSASTIGMSSTVISAMTLVAIVAATGLEPFLTRVLPGADSEERGGLCGTALVLAAAVSGVAGVAGSLLLPDRVHAAVGTGWLMGLVGAGAMSTSLLFVINAALLGVRRAELSLVANVLGSLLRLVAVAVLLYLGVVAIGADAAATHTIVGVWAASLMISFALSVRLLVRATPGSRLRWGWIWLSRLRRGVAWDHVAMLAGRLPALLLPIIAAALFPAAEVGYATVALMISSAFFAVSASVSSSLLANCADRPERLRAQARRAVRMIGVLLVAPVVVTCLLAPKVLGLFGAGYTHYSALLILLLVAALPDAAINLAIAILRVQRRLVAVAAITVTGAVLLIGGALLLMPHLGIIGAGWAAIAAPVSVASTLAVVWQYRSLISARSTETADDPSAGVARNPPDVVDVTPSVDLPLLSPVAVFSAPAEVSLPAVSDRG